MHIYAIGDLHLSGDPPSKPMEIFGEHWAGHKEKIQTNWLQTVTAEDTVIICGDISWALQLEEAKSDLQWLAQLPGEKILLRGNHDYWWTSLKKCSNLRKISFNFYKTIVLWSVITPSAVPAAGYCLLPITSLRKTRKYISAKASVWNFLFRQQLNSRQKTLSASFIIRLSLLLRSIHFLLTLWKNIMSVIAFTVISMAKTTFLCTRVSVQV